MNIVSDKEILIFRKDYKGIPKYTISLSKKNKDNSYDYGYMTVRFKKDVTLRDRTKIMIKDAWLSFTTYDNKTYPYIFINDFTITDEGGMQESNPYKEFGEQLELEESELPF